MSSLFEALTEQLGGNVMDQIGSQIGADRATAAKAVPAALGTLMGALGANSQRSGGAEALLGALQKDHDGSILDNVTGFLGQADAGPGAGILKHVLGGKRPAVEAGLGQQTGLDAASTGKLLQMLAPILMGALGKAQRSQGLDAGALRDMLGGERRTIERRAPEGIGVLGKLLDRDGDGNVMDDVGGMLSSFLKNR